MSVRSRNIHFDKGLLLFNSAGSVLIQDEAKSDQFAISMDGVGDHDRYQQQLQLIDEQVENINIKIYIAVMNWRNCAIPFLTLVFHGESDNSRREE